MSCDQIPSLQDELHAFVTQMQTRLDGLLKAVHNLRKATSEVSLAASVNAADACPRKPIGQSQERDASEWTVVAHQPSTDVAALVEVSQAVSLDTQDNDRVATKEAVAASSRLEAIKRRLAEQIQKT